MTLRSLCLPRSVPSISRRRGWPSRAATCASAKSEAVTCSSTLHAAATMRHLAYQLVAQLSMERGCGTAACTTETKQNAVHRRAKCRCAKFEAMEEFEGAKRTCKRYIAAGVGLLVGAAGVPRGAHNCAHNRACNRCHTLMHASVQLTEPLPDSLWTLLPPLILARRPACPDGAQFGAAAAQAGAEARRRSGRQRHRQ